MGELSCITDHDQFYLLILNPDVLSVAFIHCIMFKKQQGRALEYLTSKIELCINISKLQDSLSNIYIYYILPQYLQNVTLNNLRT